jgi:hypothetical protein
MHDERLEKLIPEYANVKAEADRYGKQKDGLNSQIKDIMRTMADPQYRAGEWVATLSVVKRESFDEGKLMELFSSQFKELSEAYGIIKLKPVIDMAALENAIYDNKIDPRELANCKVSNSYEKLTIKKGAK